MRPRQVLTIVLPLALIGASCGSGDGESDPPEPSRPEAATQPSNEETASSAPVSLQSAEKVRAAEQIAGDQVPMGGTADVDGLQMTVSNPVVDGDDWGTWLVVEARVENATGAASSVPYLQILCSNTDESGGWQMGSTLQLGADLPAGTFDEGVVHLTTPGDSRTGDVRPPCEPPAVIAIDGSSTRFPVDDDIVDQLNAGTMEPMSTTAPASTESSAASNATSSAPTSTIADGVPDQTSDEVEASDSAAADAINDLVAADLCENPRPREPDANALDLGFDPLVDLECDAGDGLVVNVSEWPSDDAIRGLAVVGKGMYEGFGMDPSEVMLLTFDGHVIAGVESSDGDAEAANAWVEAAAEIVDADVVSLVDLAK